MKAGIEKLFQPQELPDHLQIPVLSTQPQPEVEPIPPDLVLLVAAESGEDPLQFPIHRLVVEMGVVWGVEGNRLSECLSFR